MLTASSGAAVQRSDGAPSRWVVNPATRLAIVFAVAALILTSCGGSGDRSGAGSRSTDFEARAESGVATTPVPTPSPTVRPSASPRVAPSAAPASPGARPSPSSGPSGAQFAVNQRARSDRLGAIELVVRGAELRADALLLDVAFVNTGDEAIRVTGSVSGRDAILRDPSGAELKPSEASGRLAGSITPEVSGFAPGAATLGTLTFPRPAGDGVYELRVPGFEAVQFKLDTPAATRPSLTLPRGSFPVNQSLRSAQQGLRPIEFRVKTVQVDAQGITLALAFVNTSRQGWELTGGPKGDDLRLLDADGVPSAPLQVSDPLKASIGPKGGWSPEQEHAGTLTFPLPRPEGAGELRLVLSGYDAVTLRFSRAGLVDARVTAASGGAARPSPSPDPADLAYREIETLLARQAEAMRARNGDAWLSFFTPTARAEQQTVFARAGAMPLGDYKLRIAPNARLSGAERGKLENVEVELTYTLTDIPADNRFEHELRYDFVREGAAWKVADIDPDEHAPFWLNGDVSVRRSAHFLILSRPAAQAQIPSFEQEAENAYAALQQRGLPLEPRYVAYFTSDGGDFSKLTGRPAGRYLGVALSQFDLMGEQIKTHGRAFFINGEAFTAARRGGPAEDRQTTVTHELVHLALAKDSRPYTPPWLAEGIAVFLSDDTSEADRRRLVTDGKLDEMSLLKLTRAASLGEHDYTGTAATYQYIFSGEAVAYLVKTFGEPKLLELYRSYAALPAASVREKMPRYGGNIAAQGVFADLSVQLTAEAVRRIYARDLTQLESEIKAWIRR